MNSIILEEKAGLMQQRAWKIIEQTDLLRIWESIGAKVNLVGSLKTGLLINHRDIDFHIYTDPFILEDSFAVIARLAEDPHIHQIRYVNLLMEEDQCVEWHAVYVDEDREDWQIDMIHILPASPYAGYFEKVADRIAAVLTDETRLAILQIKDSLPAGEKVMGIQVYKAVIADGVRSYTDFSRWLAQNNKTGILQWMP